jgi:hypothetical protein
MEVRRAVTFIDKKSWRKIRMAASPMVLIKPILRK